MVAQDWGGRAGSQDDFGMNQYWEQLGWWRVDRSTRVVPPRKSDEVMGCIAGLLWASAVFAMAHIVLTAMTDMLANLVFSSCNITVLLGTRFWIAPVASVVHVRDRLFYGQSREVCWHRWCLWSLLMPICAKLFWTRRRRLTVFTGASDNGTLL